MRGHLGLGQRVAVVALGWLAGCATVEYRVPSSEVQRLAQLPPAARGSEIRVVPASTPVGPPLTAADLAPPPPPAPVAAPPPGPPPPVQQEIPPPPDEAPICADVEVGPPPVVEVPRVVVVPARAPLVPPPAFRQPIAKAPVVRPTVVRPPVFHPPVVRAPAVHHGGSGGGHHGGGGGGGAVAIAALIVLPIVVIAIIANAAAEANARAADAAAFDGWVSVDPDHLLRLHYGGATERVVPLTTLTPSDLIGVRYGILRDRDGAVTRRGWMSR